MHKHGTPPISFNENPYALYPNAVYNESKDYSFQELPEYFSQYTEINQIPIEYSQGNILVDNKRYSLKSFIGMFNKTLNHEQLLEIAQIANVYLKDSEYKFISDIEKFKNNFKNLKLCEQKYICTDGMHNPKIEGDELMFFVEHCSKNFPLKVTFNLKNGSAYYKLLNE